MAYIFDPDETAKLDAMQSEVQRVRAMAETADDRIAQRALAIKRKYPHLRKGVIMPLAMQGYGPDDEPTVVLAERAGRPKPKGGFSPFNLLKGIVRTAALAGSAPGEELQGVLRNLSTSTGGSAATGAVGGASVGAAVGSVVPVVGTGIGAAVGGGIGSLLGLLASDEVEGKADWQAQSSALIALGDALGGEKVDLGSGFLPAGKVAAEQMRRSRSVQVGGHALTPGRLVAASVVEPGTKPYTVLSGLVDFSTALKADPAALAGAKVAKVRKAAKVFSPISEAGGVSGAARKTVVAERVAEWLDGPKGRAVVDWLTDTADSHTIWRNIKGLPAERVAALADARTPDEVTDILKPLLGVQVREKPAAPAAFMVEARRLKDGVRWAHAAPGRGFDLEDLGQSTDELERMLRNAKVGDDVVGTYVNDMLRAANPNARYEVIVRAMKTVESKVAQETGSASKARSLTRLFREQYEEGRHFFVNEAGDDVSVLGAVVDGKMTPTPHLPNEMIHRIVPMPDPRAMRRATSKLGRFLDSPAGKTIDIPLALAEWTMSTVWKPVTLLRGAWTFKVVGEEQVRMAGADLESSFRHPLSFIATAVSEKKGGGRLARDIKGGLFNTEDEVSAIGQAVTFNGNDPWVGRVQMLGRKLFKPDEDGFVDAWIAELRKQKESRIAAHAAGKPLPDTSVAPTIDDLVAHYWDGPGAKVRLRMSDAPGGEVFKTKVRTDPGSYLTDGKVLSFQDYIESVFDRVRVYTKGDPDLAAAVASGKFGDKEVVRALKAKMRAMADEGTAPDQVPGLIPPRQLHNGRGLDFMNSAVQTMFTALMSRPSSYLSRSPAFRQFYWRRVEEMVPFMDEAARTKVFAQAAKTKVGEDVLARMRRAADANPAGTLKLSEADEVAKGWALQQTHDLLFDVADRNNFDEMMSVVFPFASAWREILLTWSKLSLEEPRVLRRGQQIVEGAREAGFFFPDPQTGEEMFAFPGSEALTRALTGVPFPVVAPVQGLNLAASNPIIPGVGPVVALPFSRLLPNKPEFDSIRSLVLPFGDPDASLAGQGPAWLKKVRMALSDPESDRMFGSAVMDVMEYLASTGRYDTSTQEGMQKLNDDAVKKARVLTLLRAVTQFGAPSPPKLLAVTEDADGQKHFAAKLAERFHEMQFEDYQTAPQRFLAEFGDNALMAMVNKSEGGFAPTDELHDFVRRNPGVVRDFDKVYGFFTSSSSEFNFEEYNRQLATGERKALKPSEAAQLANAKIASMQYRMARDRLGTTRLSTEQREWLSRLRGFLIERYPGWNPEVFTRGEVDVAIRQISKAVDDPRLAKSPLTPAIAKYLAARTVAQQQAEQSGLASFESAKRAQPLREWLRSVASMLMRETPDFGVVWDQLFDRELANDDPQLVAA